MHQTNALTAAVGAFVVIGYVRVPRAWVAGRVRAGAQRAWVRTARANSRVFASLL